MNSSIRPELAHPTERLFQNLSLPSNMYFNQLILSNLLSAFGQLHLFHIAEVRKHKYLQRKYNFST